MREESAQQNLTAKSCIQGLAVFVDKAHEIGNFRTRTCPYEKASAMSLDDRLHSLLYSRKSGAIVLQGSWGRGKTYFWQKKVVAPFLSDHALSRRSRQYSYVSLFGINGLAELKAAIFQASEEADSSNRGVLRQAVNLRWWWWLGRKLLSIVLDSGDVPYTVAVSKVYTALTFYSIRNRLICLDDIERRGKDLSLLDVMGLITQLSEQRNCRICVILNTGALSDDDQKTWNENKEKTFIGELTYAPTSEQCVDLVLDDVKDTSWGRTARRRLVQLEITNIRVIQRARDFIETALATIADRSLREDALDSIVSIVVLLTFAHSGKGEGAPPIDLVMRSNEMSDALDEVMGKNKEKTPEQKRWSKILSDYGLYLGDELDIALRNMIETGYPDSEQLREAIIKFDSGAELQHARQLWRDAWKLYHDHLDENQQQLLDALQERWPAVSAIESANNLQWLAHVLRLLGRPEVATSFIRTWVEQRAAERSEELTPREYNTFDVVRDDELLAEIQKGYSTAIKPLSLLEALRAVSNNYGRDDVALKVIAQTNVVDLVGTLDSHPGSWLHDAVKYTLAMKEDSGLQFAKEAASNMAGALRLISQRSDLSKERVKHKFEIDESEQTGSPRKGQE